MLALGAELTTGACTGALLLYLVRALGPEGYGLFALALSIGTLAMLPSDLGLSQSAARFLAERRGDRAAMGKILAEALRIKVLVALGLSVLLFALAGPIASAFSEPGLAWPLRAMAVAVFGQSIVILFRSSFEAMGHMSADWKMVASEALIETAASVLLVALAGGAAAAVWGRAIGYAAGALIAIAIAVRLLGRSILSRGSTIPGFRSRLARYGAALVIVDGVYALFSRIDILLLGAMLSPRQAGFFAAPLQLTTLLGYPASAITAGIAPRLAQGRRSEGDVRSLELGLRGLIVLQALALAPVVVWAEPIVDFLFGNDFGRAADALRAMAPFIFLVGTSRLVTIGVNYLGQARRRIPLALTALALNVGVDLLLIPKWGVVGAAIGTDLAYALYAFGHLRICHQLTGLPLLPLLATLGRALVATAAMAGVLLALGTGDVSVPLLFAGLLGGTAVFAVVMAIVREPVVAEFVALVPPLRPVLRFLPGR